jgi:hypothetical protein
MANVIHLFSAAHNLELLRRTRAHVPDGARLLLADFWTDATHTQPPFAALMAGEFFVITGEGDVYSEEEARGWLALYQHSCHQPQSSRVPLRALCACFRQVTKNSPFTDLQSIRNLWNRQALTTKNSGSVRPDFGRAFLSSPVHATPFRHGDPRRLTFSSIFRLDFRQPEEDTGHHAAQRAAQIDLLRHDDDPHIMLTPVR